MAIRSQPFARARAMFALLAAAASLGMGARQEALANIGTYRSRGKGEGCISNKRAKSSFKQNKRRGL